MSRWLLFFLCLQLACESTSRKPQPGPDENEAQESKKAGSRSAIEPDEKAPAQAKDLPTWKSVISRWARKAPEVDEPQFTICDSELCMKLGDQPYLLGTQGTEIEEIARAKDAYTLTYGLSYACNDPSGRQLTISRDHIEARWTNSLAFRKYQSGDFEAAAEGFATASRHDPSFEKARISLASSLIRLGNLDAATASLLKDDGTLSVNILWQALHDDDLTPLRNQEMFRRAASAPRQAGEVPPLTYGARGLHPVGVLVSEGRGWAAIVSSHQSWGTEQSQESLDIFDLRTGQRLHRQELTSWRDTDEVNRLLPERAGEVKKRLNTATEFLKMLGFAAPSEADLVTADKSPNLNSILFSKQNFGVTVDASTVRIFRSGELVERHASPLQLGYMRKAHYLPGHEALIIETHLDEPEGCLLEKDIAASVLVPLEKRL